MVRTELESGQYRLTNLRQIPTPRGGTRVRGREAGEQQRMTFRFGYKNLKRYGPLGREGDGNTKQLVD